MRRGTWSGRATRRSGSATRVGFGALVERASSLARSRGELGILADALGMRAGQLALGQRFDEASGAAREALELTRELRAGNLELYPLAALAVVAAVRGDDEEAQRLADDALARATVNG